MTPEDCVAARQRLGWSIDALAEAAGISDATIRDFERAFRVPREGTLIAIRRAFRDARAERAFGPAPGLRP